MRLPTIYARRAVVAGNAIGECPLRAGTGCSTIGAFDPSRTL